MKRVKGLDGACIASVDPADVGHEICYIMDDLPNECLEAIISYLDDYAVARFRATCHYARRVCDAYASPKLLYTFGCNGCDRCGRFGNFDCTQGILPNTCGVFQGYVAGVSCGSFHTALWTTHGHVYTFGSGAFGKLGYCDTSQHDMSTPQRIEGPFQGHVVGVSCGSFHTALWTRGGYIYTFGNGIGGQLGDNDTSDHAIHTPLYIEGPFQGRVVGVSCGTYHTALWTSQCNVYMFGDGTMGKLGDGDVEEHASGTPLRIEGPFQGHVIGVSCGDGCTAIWTSEGDIYTFGSGGFGTLGNGDTNNRDVGVPLRIEGSFQGHVTGVSCGTFHTALWTREGDVYIFGDSLFGKLGNGDTTSRYVATPWKIEGPFQGHVAGASCGYYHTALWTTCGYVYTFGAGLYGTLCDGNTSNHNVGTPLKIEGPFQGHVAGVSCGVRLTALWTQQTYKSLT